MPNSYGKLFVMVDESLNAYDRFLNALKRLGPKRYVKLVENNPCRILVRFEWEDYSHKKDSSIDNEYIQWCGSNCEGQFYVYNAYYVLFEIEEDAMAFKLRWL